MFLKVSLPRPARQPRGAATIRITSGAGRWYADRIGEVMAVEFTDNHGYWAREGGTYNAINYVLSGDAEILEVWAGEKP